MPNVSDQIRVVVSVVPPVVLVTAGLMKLFSLVPNFSGAVVGGGTPGHILFGVGLFEIVLSLWLVSGCRPKLGLWVAIVFFLTALLYSTFATIKGERTCPCFGSLRTSTFFASGLSMLCIVILLIRASPRTKFHAGSPELVACGIWLFSILGGGLLLVGMLQIRFGSDAFAQWLNKMDGQFMEVSIVDGDVRRVDYLKGFSERF